MELVSGTEMVVREVGRWQPTDIAFVRRITFSNFSTPDLLFDLALIVLLQPRPPMSKGWPDPSGKYWEVDILFERVRDLTLTICGPWDFQTPGFVFEDIRDRQWEGVKLLVSDYEHLTAEGIKFARGQQ